MKRFRPVLALTLAVLTIVTAACGGQGPAAEPTIQTAAAGMNFSADDLGADWTLNADQGLDAMQEFQQEHIQDANLRMFGAEKITGLLISVVLSTKTVDSAKQEMAGETVQNLGTSLQEQLPDVTMANLDLSGVGDEAVMAGGKHAGLGLNVYMVTLRKANVISMFSVIGSEDVVTEDLAREYARTLEAKIH